MDRSHGSPADTNKLLVLYSRYWEAHKKNTFVAVPVSLSDQNVTVQLQKDIGCSTDTAKICTRIGFYLI